MSDVRMELQTHSIVLRGDFNPKIFLPSWFGKQELITKNEEETANIEMVHHDLVIFRLEEWLYFEVTRDRLIASTTQSPFYETLNDLILGTFQLLIHTPVKSLGINFDTHFQMNSEEEWHNFGDKLAPKELWNDILKNSGLRSLTIEEGKIDEKYKGYLRVKVEPSVRIHPGIYIQTNDHFEITNDNNNKGANEVIQVLSDWDNSQKRANEILNYLTNKI